ncbi:nitric oxide reductase activation protein NorD [Acidithiobacillus caldus]|uniref:Rubisco activation protein CbbO n=1 Tax=Acidithiobacillus caldus (strain ATCC 51756 / DSM 8584 / KU) TaxID=637389 RepID=A0A059ZY35_ACICK|nr:VWA domain-containing protein [Acidithiobacillus caldus]AIA54797.1 Rubisco activation protein CbbO [Acidithiobacillus caldus ATCC 51756]MBU2730404.1 VWA domain-containing protein [Acidithiobacillus caldus]MBU2735674.1 VWA domain-containing protein [Acidithiobacillus caldus ATCC 51756]MBU2744029.1 VWA domain-containing protein [Acidithiobacillus caldus]MBU2779409.1 VWA domain-containing protein [Acidithiobacillus caldus]
MAIQLSDYPDILEALGDHAAELLASQWHEAARVFSHSALEAYLQGAVSLKALGRGSDLVLAYIESAPQVAREIGEQAVFEMLSAAIRMFSKTSAEVLTLFFSSAPFVARRLGEIELFRGYLLLLDQLLAQAPRGVRPMLGKIEALLEQMTLGGLRRWAAWGISAYRNDFAAQAEYFGLQSEQSRAVLQQERRGLLFIDVQRRLIMYLRALWGRDFFLRPTSGDFETRQGYRPYIEQYFIHVPDAYDDWENAHGQRVTALELFRAAVAHAAAHVVLSQYDLRLELAPAEQKLWIGLLEDAWVEREAMARFPGLLPLWQRLLQVPATQEREREAAFPAVLDRCALALLDPDYGDDHPLVARARSAFAALLAAQPQDASARYTEILQRAQELAAAAAEAGLELPGYGDDGAILYRDDNRYLWTAPASQLGDILAGGPPQVRKYVSLMEMINAVDVETAGDDAQEIWVLATEFFDDDGTTFNEREGKAPVSQPVSYPEWDYQTQLERPLWVTLYEKRPKMGDPEVIHAFLEAQKPLVQRLKKLIEAVQPQGVIRQRKVEDGDEIDINAAVLAFTDIRMGQQPDPRIGIRTRLHTRDLSVLLLIDLSESTNDRLRSRSEGDVTVLQLAREAAVLLAEALERIGDPFMLCGFDSNGRHDVEFYTFKDFAAEYDDKVKGRLAGMTGQLSTRMGAALRHAGHLLDQQPSQKKLLLLLTDGEPSDNDVRDPQYLRFDAKKAVEELARRGIRTFCLSLDPYADEYVSRIFGARNYLVLDHIDRLPERLPQLYLAMTK